MNSKAIIFLVLLLTLNRSIKTEDDDEADTESGSTTSGSSSETTESSDTSSDASTDTSSGSTGGTDTEKPLKMSVDVQKEIEEMDPADKPDSEKGQDKTTESNAADRAQSDCPKTCHNNKLEKYHSQCATLKFKMSEKAKSLKECTEMCKKFAICSSALFVKPRSITTLDLNTLYNKVIDSENWVSLKDPTNLLEYYKDIDQEKSGHKNSLTHDLHDSNEEYDETQLEDESHKYALINMSTLVNKGERVGTCYIFDDKLAAEQKLNCSQSQLTFTAYEIDCIEDQECADKRPRKQCPKGKCGKTCKDFNTIHIQNSCMGKYFFGHLEADTLDSCLEFCLSNKDCKSVDFGNMGTCLLNYVNRNDTQLMMGCDNKNNEIWDYYEIINDSECIYEKPHPSASEDTCLNVPGICKNGGNCEAVQLPPPHQSFTYDCNCPCNWCGNHCEKLNMKTFRNGCLNSSVLVWSVAESAADCIDMCLDELHCKSVSYCTSSGTCVLHWTDHHTEEIVASHKCPAYRTDITEKEWTYFEIICNSSVCHSSVEVIEVKELKGCASNPCLNGGECGDIYQRGKLIGYHCLCRCGFCGDRCETQNYVTTEDACIWKSHISDTPSEYYKNSSSLNACLNFCASKFPICRSVDFSNKGECLLNNRDSDSAIVTQGCNNYMRQRWALYDLSCVCNNRPVIY